MHSCIHIQGSFCLIPVGITTPKLGKIVRKVIPQVTPVFLPKKPDFFPIYKTSSDISLKISTPIGTGEDPVGMVISGEVTGVLGVEPEMKRSVSFSGADVNEKDNENEKNRNVSEKEFNTKNYEIDLPEKNVGLSVIDYLNLSRYLYLYLNVYIYKYMFMYTHVYIYIYPLL
jgi:hypothetical protein